MAQGFFDALARQHAAMQDSSGVAAPKLPLPESEVMAAMQKEFAEKHAALWSSMLGRKPGEPGRRWCSPSRATSASPRRSGPRARCSTTCARPTCSTPTTCAKVADAMPIADGRAKSRMQFLTRQYIDALAPSNFAATNPEFIKTALETKGESITRGMQNLLGDLEKGRISMTDDSAFEIGRNLRHARLGGLRKRADAADPVRAADREGRADAAADRAALHQQVLHHGPAAGELAGALHRRAGLHGLPGVVEEPAGRHRAHYGWDDYLDKGPLAALEVVRAITRVKKPNVLGFCVGGTILTSALAVARARRRPGGRASP
jgi:polyhydroxyalkanoate synthase